MENIVNHDSATEALNNLTKHNTHIQLTPDQVEKFYEGWSACEQFHLEKTRQTREHFEAVGR